MAVHRTIVAAEASQGNAALTARLLEAVGAVDDGVWIDVAGWFPFCFEINGITVATVQIRGSLAPTKPANTVHGFQVGANVTTTGSQNIASLEPLRWVKARVSAWTSGSIDVDMISPGND